MRRITGARVGLAVARQLEGFGVRLSYHNRRRRDDVPYTDASSPLALTEACDVLVIAATDGSQSEHLVDRVVLEALVPRGFLVNVARASVVRWA